MSQTNISPVAHNKRVLFGDTTLTKFDQTITGLKAQGVTTEGFADVDKMLSRIEQVSVDVCVINLLLGGVGPFQLIHRIKSSSKNPKIKVIVISKQVHKLNIQNTIRAGADDFLAEPFDVESLFHRVVYHLSPKIVVNDVGMSPTVDEVDPKMWKLVLEAVDTLSQTERTNIHSGFLKVLTGLAESLDSNRTSLIIVDKNTASGVVLASSDDPNFYDFPITLTKYPEILHVVNAGNIVLIEDVSRNWLTYKIRENVKSIQIGSIMAFPVRYQGEIVGALTIRRREAIGLPKRGTLAGLQCLANILAAHANLKILLRKIYSDFAVNE